MTLRERARGSRATWALCLASLAFTAAVLGAAPMASLLVAETAGIRGGEAWRLVTGPLVHGTWAHLGRDLTVIAAMGIVYEPVLRGRWVAAIALGVVVPGGWIALAHPEASACFGLSGLTYTMIVVALAHEWRGSRGVLRWAVSAFAVAAAVKLTWEATTGTLLMPMDIGGGRPAPEAHFAGAVAGLALLGARTSTSACLSMEEPA